MSMVVEQQSAFVSNGVYMPLEPKLEPQPTWEELPTAPLITVIAASGGTGRSTVALLAAWLAADAGLSVGLIEGDLQFGDYSMWLGLDDELPMLGDPTCEPINIHPNLALYRAPLFPEAADEVTDLVAAQVDAMRIGYDLVIADTGGFWSGLTADLLVKADLYLMLMDQRVSSVMGAVRASELCSRLGVPGTRMVPVSNRWVSRPRYTKAELSQAFDSPDVFCVSDGRNAVEEYLSVGAIEDLVDSGNPAVKSIDELLSYLLPKVGRLFPEKPFRRKRSLL